MISLPFLLAPLALLLPADAGAPGDSALSLTAEAAEAREGFAASPSEFRRFVEALRAVPYQEQVRIEERVIIRISTPSAAAIDRLLSQLPRRPLRQSYQEERLDGCVAIDSIVGVQPANENRLLLFMRDRRVLSAALDRTCQPRDFYAGFYIERSRDGQLCSRRDKLQSRAGASCEVAQLSRLIAVRD